MNIDFGAGELQIQPGADGTLISGSATYNVKEIAPNIEIDGAKVSLETGNLNIQGIPKFNNDIKNDWDIRLGDMPLNLSINAGAYNGDMELGGLAIKSLQVGDGAANVRLSFTEPNLVEMSTLQYISGASTVKLTGLANANFSSMIFRSGAGDYTLDFSGELQRDAIVTIESGISQVTIIVPHNTSTMAVVSSGLSNISSSGSWKKSGNTYQIEGDGPTITINVSMGAGHLELKTR